jgi:hypothetical protein
MGPAQIVNRYVRVNLISHELILETLVFFFRKGFSGSLFKNLSAQYNLFQ